MVPLESSDGQRIRRTVLSDSPSLLFPPTPSHLTTEPLLSWRMEKKKVSADLKELDRVFWILGPSLGNGDTVSVADRNPCMYKILPHGMNFLNLSSVQCLGSQFKVNAYLCYSFFTEWQVSSLRLISTAKQLSFSLVQLGTQKEYMESTWVVSMKWFIKIIKAHNCIARVV